MCGRFYLDVRADELASYFDLPSAPSLTPRYNIAPSQNVTAIRIGEQGREWVRLHWGLIPFWAKDKKIGYRTINARAETVESKPAFRAAFKYRRCLIPASGFFEWQASKDGKQPYCIHPKEATLFAFAGLYEHWQGSTGESIDSCTILVTEANAVVAPVHDRMPVILKPEYFTTWLDPEVQSPSMVKPLLTTYPADETTLFPVSRKVNSPRYDDPECITPLIL
jgi:putative SOS response-associated peptidase YedK